MSDPKENPPAKEQEENQEKKQENQNQKSKEEEKPQQQEIDKNNAEIPKETSKTTKNTSFKSSDPAPASSSSQTRSNPLEPEKSVEGWVIIVRNVHEETKQDDIQDLFSEFGEIQNIHLNLDRLSGSVKGYCLIEFKKRNHAQNAIDAMNGYEFREKKFIVDWTYIKDPRPSNNSRRYSKRQRSPSPNESRKRRRHG